MTLRAQVLIGLLLSLPAGGLTQSLDSLKYFIAFYAGGGGEYYADRTYPTAAVIGRESANWGLSVNSEIQVARKFTLGSFRFLTSLDYSFGYQYQEYNRQFLTFASLRYRDHSLFNSLGFSLMLPMKLNPYSHFIPKIGYQRTWASGKDVTNNIGSFYLSGPRYRLGGVLSTFIRNNYHFNCELMYNFLLFDSEENFAGVVYSAKGRSNLITASFGIMKAF